MIENFIEQVKNELDRQNFYNTDYCLKQTEKKITKLIAKGQSEESVITSLGSPKDYAIKIINDNCAKSKGEVYLNDFLFFGISCLIAGAGTFAMTFIAGLSGICGCMYTLKAFTDPIFATGGKKAGAFFVALCGIAMCALGIWLTYEIIKKMKAGIENHLKIRKYNMSRL